MRQNPRSAGTKKSNVRVVFIDILKQQMQDLKALRKKVAEAERLVAPRGALSGEFATHALEPRPLGHFDAR